MSKQKVVRLQDLLKRDHRALKLLVDAGQTVVARNNKSGRVRTVPVRALYQNNPRFYAVSGGSYDYLVTEEAVREVLRKIQRYDESKARAPKKHEPRENAEYPEEGDEESSPGLHSAMAPNFGDEYERLEELPREERLSLLEQGKALLKELSERSDATAEEVNDALVTTTTDAALTNKVTIQEALRMGNEEAKQYTEQLVSATQEMLRSTALLVDNELYNEELISRMVERSNGTVVQHMTRVFLTGFAFMLYYNRQILTSSLANRIRIDFRKRYKKHYRKLLPHLHEDYLSLEHVFYGGIKALSDLEINRFATGFLVHDVGKAEDIEYHEGEAGYDRETVVRHVKLGYKAVMNKTAYPREAALITGYHHEYYGDASGYGYFREFLQAYRNMQPDAKIDYVMSYEMEPLIDYQVMAYFPAKMLEVVDVFDSLTDPNRKYRAPLTTVEAIEVLEEEFVEKKLKVDPIILDLFKRFLRERGILE
ncbi:MAG: metal-dependent phosphohydrolase [Spirochaetaceae bacterium]